MFPVYAPRLSVCWSSLAQVEQLLAGCSGFIYLGTERFMANVPPVKLAAMDLSGTLPLIYSTHRILRPTHSLTHQAERHTPFSSHWDLYLHTKTKTPSHPVTVCHLLTFSGDTTLNRSLWMHSCSASVTFDTTPNHLWSNDSHLSFPQRWCETGQSGRGGLVQGPI